MPLRLGLAHRGSGQQRGVNVGRQDLPITTAEGALTGPGSTPANLGEWLLCRLEFASGLSAAGETAVLQFSMSRCAVVRRSSRRQYGVQRT
jgi:hypothetical protein